MSIENLINSILTNYRKLETENKQLRKELKFFKMDDETIDELLTDEEVIMNNDSTMIEKVTNRLLKNNIDKKGKQAILIAIADSSGSMGIWEKYMGRSYITWIKSILLKKYSSLNTRFILHAIEANEVTEIEFLTKGDSGGTLSSKGIKLANKIIEEYNYEDSQDVYIVYISDGDNLYSDAPITKEFIEKRLLKKAKLFTYFEINQYNRNSTLMDKTFKNISDSKLNVSVVKSRYDMRSSIDQFLNKLI